MFFFFVSAELKTTVLVSQRLKDQKKRPEDHRAGFQSGVPPVRSGTFENTCRRVLAERQDESPSEQGKHDSKRLKTTTIWTTSTLIL